MYRDVLSGVMKLLGRLLGLEIPLIADLVLRLTILGTLSLKTALHLVFLQYYSLSLSSFLEKVT
jgi:hypothetical protein